MILSIHSTVAFYVVVDLSFKAHSKKFKRLNDVRLYQVSPCDHDRIGLLVGGKNQAEAISHVFQLIALVGLSKTPR